MNRVLILLIFNLFLINGLAQENAYPLETVLQKGHSKYLTAYAFSPDGKYLATGAYDNSVILWSFATGKQIRLFNRHTEPVRSVEFSPDGKYLLTSASDNSAKYYDVISGNMIYSFDMGRSEINIAYFSTDGKLAVLEDKRDELKIFNLQNGSEVNTFKKNFSYRQKMTVHPNGQQILTYGNYAKAYVQQINNGDTLKTLEFDKPYSMSFSPDGKLIAISSAKLFASVYDANTGQKKFDLRDDSEERCDGCNTKHVFSNQGKFILTMSSKVDAILWDQKTGKKIKSINSHKGGPQTLAFSPDDQYCLISFSEEVFVYDTKSGKEKLHVENEFISGFEFKFSPDGQYIVIPGPNNEVEIWNVESGKKKREFSGFLNSEKNDGLRFSYTNWTETSILKYITYKKKFALSPDGKSIAIGGVDSSAILLDLETGRVQKQFVGHSQVVLALTFSPDGKYLATAGGDRKINIWDLSTGKLERTLKGHRELIFELDYNADGTQLVSGCWDGTYRIWELDSEEYRYVDLGNVSPYVIGFTPNNNYIFSGDLGGENKFFDADAGEASHKLVGHTKILGGFDFSNDSKRMATASWDGTVKYWHVYGLMVVSKHYEHQAPVYAVDIHPTKEWIASGGGDNSIVIWDGENNQLVKKLEGHSSAVTDLQFTEDGNQLISYSSEGVLKIWDLNSFTEIYSRIQISRNDWLATLPNGYFDGSSNALNMVNYVSGIEVVPIGSLFDKYYSPNLLRRISEGEKFNDTGENLNKTMKEAPLIALHINDGKKRGIEIHHDSVYKAKSPVLSVGVEVNSQGIGVKEIRIYNNGKLVISEPYGDNIVFRGGEKDVQYFDINLSDGDNRISAMVINENSTESEATEVIVRHDGVAALTDLFIFSIGINKYKNPSYNLSFAVNDSKEFTKSMKNGAGELFNQVHEFSVTNENATKEGIMAVFNQIKEEIGPEDVFVFYYAGHGVMNYEENEEESDFYIVTHNITNLYGDPAMLKLNGVSASDLMNQSMEIAAEKQLYVLDACHSGGALNSFATRGDGREKALAQLARSTGTFFLTASQDAQYANESGNLEHGLFTFALLEILNGQGGDNGDKKITINEMKSYVEDRVPELSEQYHGSPQYPTSYSFGQDFPIVILK